MCERCENDKKVFKDLFPKRRLKLWELKPVFHCSILGTCLSMDELRKVMRQSGVTLGNKPSDYDLHGTMVGQAEEKGRTSRNLHKMLERKYKRWTQALSRCKDETELARHWNEALHSGDIAGTFWAIMTHPYANPELVSKAYEDVHMLSHLQGASNRADLKRTKALEKEVAELKEMLSKTRQNHNYQIMRRDELIRRQEQEFFTTLGTVPTKQTTEDKAGLEIELRKQNQALSKRLDWAEKQLVEREMRNTRLQEEMAALKELVDEAQEERTATEQTMTLLLAERNNTGAKQDHAINLHGKRILYVGGRSTLTPHLRSLVEAHNGRFDCHDGGREESRAGLQCVLAGADMVFCPVDCISHDACQRVKRHCQQQAKEFVPLRSSGLSAFAAGLQQYSSMNGSING